MWRELRAVRGGVQLSAAWPEVLAPASDWECAKAAVENGADAIYFGLERFNARFGGLGLIAILIHQPFGLVIAGDT